MIPAVCLSLFCFCFFVFSHTSIVETQMGWSKEFGFTVVFLQYTQNPQGLLQWVAAQFMLPGVKTYRLVIRLVAVVASGQVSYGWDSEAAALFRIRVLAIVVAQALKQAADHILVVADEIGVLADVVAVSGGEAEKKIKNTKSFWVSVSPQASVLRVRVLLFKDGSQLLRKAGLPGSQIGNHLSCYGCSTHAVLVQHKRTTHVPCNTHMAAVTSIFHSSYKALWLQLPHYINQECRCESQQYRKYLQKAFQCV